MTKNMSKQALITATCAYTCVAMVLLSVLLKIGVLLMVALALYLYLMFRLLKLERSHMMMLVSNEKGEL